MSIIEQGATQEDEMRVRLLIKALNDAIEQQMAVGPIEHGDLISALANMLTHHALVCGVSLPDMIELTRETYKLHCADGKKE